MFNEYTLNKLKKETNKKKGKGKGKRKEKRRERGSGRKREQGGSYHLIFPFNSYNQSLGLVILLSESVVKS